MKTEGVFNLVPLNNGAKIMIKFFDNNCWGGKNGTYRKNNR
ncbi:MAG: hypothetical protein V2I35_01125 [Desulfocapsaceae bacterium]|nr:hypothetical protein [Desulfocapsaceae bacterium]